VIVTGVFVFGDTFDGFVVTLHVEAKAGIADIKKKLKKIINFLNIYNSIKTDILGFVNSQKSMTNRNLYF